MLGLSALTVIGAITACVVFITTISLIAAVLWSQLRKNTQQIVRDENQDLRNRVDTLEDKLDEAVAREEECQRRLSELEASNEVMRDLVTGANSVTAVAELATTLAFNHAEVMERLTKVEKGLARRVAPRR